MKEHIHFRYFSNCFILLIPIFIWNILLIDDLPESYSNSNWKSIPSIIEYSEIILKIVVFLIPLSMIFSLKTKLQMIGFWVYLFGLLVYFLSWYLQISFPDSTWSLSIWGFMAPAYSSIFFFIGIGLIGKESFFKIPNMTIIYIIISVVFVIIHTLHPYFVFIDS